MSIDLHAIKARLARVAEKWPTTGVLAPGADEFGPKAWAAHGPLRCHATEQGRARGWTQANADADFITAAPGDIATCVEAVEGLREKLTRDHAAHMSREDWFASIIDNVEEGRIKDRHAVIDFLRALGHTAAAEAIADAGYPLFACLPPVTEATMKKVGGNTP